LKNVPVLHFFTGQHSDYHKPTDDVEKINFEGEQKVLEYIFTLIDTIDNLPRLQFRTTRNAEQAKSSFKVTLGIMPDYAFEGKGLRVDGVTEGKPASKAGLMQGDIIIQLGEYKVQEIQEYMKALNHFSKGETSTVSILRGQGTLTFPVTF
jgi:C-terminal processing protease CtpA/Prc